MGTIAARKFVQILRNAENVVAMEMLAAAQAIDLLKPHKPASAVLAAYEKIREVIPYALKDRVFSKDIMKLRELIQSDQLVQVIRKSVGELEF